MLRGLTWLALACALLASSPAPAATRTLDDYRHFRAVSLDLQGRIPTRQELTDFESDTFSWTAWIDAHLNSAPYADRLSRVYLDLLRLQLGPSFQFVPSQTTLRRVAVLGPDGQTFITIYFRQAQRRARQETDAAFCLTQAETGLQFPNNASPTGTAIPVTQALLDQYTTLVSPWWLYADYDAQTPSNRYGPAWAATHPGFVPGVGLQIDVADGGLATALDAGTPVQQVRVCKEEAQVPAMGTVYLSGRPNVDRTQPPPFGRLTYPPNDSAYQKAHHGEPLDCTAASSYAMSIDCGCGVGLERCLPSPSTNFETSALSFQGPDPLGSDQPVDQATQQMSSWERLNWSEEAAHFLTRVFKEDRDFREVLNGRWSVINGPLAQFYRAVSPTTCCTGNALTFNVTKSPPLFDPAQIPADLRAHALNDWRVINDRGPNASGILTMPVFLTKYGSRRARAHVMYTAFLCKDFVAPNVALTPSTDPNLMERNGCQACHATLEPLAAYFSRIPESDWSWLSPSAFPVKNPLCYGNPDSGVPHNGACVTYYDPAFQTPDAGMLRGAYGSPANAELGPAGIAAQFIQDPAFAPCVAQNVASALLGRKLDENDAALQADLTDVFVNGGYKMSALVRAVLLSDSYAKSNNLSSAVWRDGGH